MVDGFLLHAAFDSRGDIALWLFFLIPCLVMAIGVPLIYRSSHWGGTRRPGRPSHDRGGEPV